MRAPGRKQHRPECEHLHDLVRPLLVARGEHVERPDDRVATVPRSLDDLLEPAAQDFEALGVLRGRDRLEFRSGEGEEQLPVRDERAAQAADLLPQLDEPAELVLRALELPCHRPGVELLERELDRLERVQVGRRAPTRAGRRGTRGRRAGRPRPHPLARSRKSSNTCTGRVCTVTTHCSPTRHSTSTSSVLPSADVGHVDGHVEVLAEVPEERPAVVAPEARPRSPGSGEAPRRPPRAERLSAGRGRSRGSTARPSSSRRLGPVLELRPPRWRRTAAPSRERLRRARTTACAR